MTNTAPEFIDRLAALRPADASASDDYRGVGMGQIFALVRDCMEMDPEQIELLLDSPIHAVRVGAVSIMDWQARNRKTPPSRRRELFESGHPVRARGF